MAACASAICKASSKSLLGLQPCKFLTPALEHDASYLYSSENPTRRTMTSFGSQVIAQVHKARPIMEAFDMPNTTSYSIQTALRPTRVQQLLDCVASSCLRWKGPRLGTTNPCTAYASLTSFKRSDIFPCHLCLCREQQWHNSPPRFVCTPVLLDSIQDGIPHCAEVLCSSKSKIVPLHR